MPEDMPVPEGATALVVSHPPSGSQRVLFKGKNGKFVKKNRPLPEVKEVVRQARNFLNKAQAGPDGKLTKDSKNRLITMWETMYRIATTQSEDPKAMMAAVQAFKEMNRQAFGEPGRRKVDDEGETQENGIKFVVISQAALPHSEVINFDEQKTPQKPSFIDAEVVETNPAPQDSNAQKDSQPQ